MIKCKSTIREHLRINSLYRIFNYYLLAADSLMNEVRINFLKIRQIEK